MRKAILGIMRNHYTYTSTKTKLLRTPQLAKELGVSEKTISNWRERKRIPYMKQSTRLIVYSLDAVLEALAKGKPSEGTGLFYPE